jgi:hypothetical protein
MTTLSRRLITALGQPSTMFSHGTFQSAMEPDHVVQRQFLVNVQLFGTRNPPADAIDYINSDEGRYSQLANSKTMTYYLSVHQLLSREATEHPMDEHVHACDESGKKDRTLQ